MGGHNGISIVARTLCWIALSLVLAVPAARGGPVSIPGSFDVSVHGQATYTIPIEVPPGTGGMAPALSLQYDSGVGEGLLGMGWSLGGLSSITRCPQTIAQDGVSGGISLNDGDRFCLDGQRLVAINGAYGADGTEYRTEIESNTKVVSYGRVGNGPAWFKVWTSSGQIMELGNNADSRRVPQYSSTVRTWMVNRISDRAGNYLTVSYSNDGEFVPARIDYTGNAAGGLAPYNAVTFEYELRATRKRTYSGGGADSMMVRLSHIRTYAGGQHVSTYRLTYSNGTPGATPVSQLVHLDRQAADGSSVLGTTFEWTPSNIRPDGAIGMFGAAFSDLTVDLNLWMGDPVGAYWTPIVGDFNGDGRTDYMLLRGSVQMVFLSRGNGGFDFFWSDAGYDYGADVGLGFTPLTGDFNGDGRTDYMVMNGSWRTVFFSNGNGTFQGISSNLFAINVDFGNQIGQTFVPIVGDFNGDGRTDYMLMVNHEQFVFLSRGDGNFDYRYNTLPYTLGLAVDIYRQWVPVIGDFNGDGRTDFLILNGSGRTVHWSNGDGSFTQVFTDGLSDFGQTIGEMFTVFSGDFNGDGLTDYTLMRDQYQRIYYSRGNAEFDYYWITWPWNFGNNVRVGWTPIVGDFNGDGCSDFALIQGSGLLVFYCVGNADGWGFSPVWSDAGGAYGINFGAEVGRNFMVLTGDFGGDGKTDYLLLRGGVRWTYLTDARSVTPTSSTVDRFPHSRIHRITPGLFDVISIAYKPLTTGVYYKGCCQPVPIVDVQPATFVVARVEADNFELGVVATDYSYGGALIDLTGRGFLGFRTRQVCDPQSRLCDTVTSQQLYPFTGLPMERVKTHQDTGAILSQTWTNYGATALGGTRRRITTGTVTVNSNDLDGTPLPTVTTTYEYDGYGNATRIDVATAHASNTAVTTTINTYDAPDTANWIFGRLNRAQVTSGLSSGGSQTRTSSFAYSPTTGLLIQEVIEPDDPTLRRQTDYGHDAFGNRVTVTVRATGLADRAVTTIYDAATKRFPVSITNALNQTETREYDPKFGRMTKVTDANGVVATTEYDLFGRPAKEVRPDGTQMLMAYQAASLETCWGLPCVYAVTTTTVNASQAQIGPKRQTVYDRFDHLLAEQVQGYDGPDMPTGDNWIIVRDNRHDRLGRVVASSRPRFAGSALIDTIFQYDALGRVVRETAPDGSYQTFAYHGLSVTQELRSAGNALLASTTTVKNVQGKVASVTDPAGNTTTYRYDPLGNLVGTTDVAGNVTTMTYDRRGRKTAMSDPDLSNWAYVYDAFDQLVSQTDAKGQISGMTYDALGRLIERREADLVSCWKYDTAPNGVGKLAKASTLAPGDTCSPTATPTYVRSHAYDNRGRTTQVETTIDGVAYTLGYGFDADTGKPTTVTYPNALVTRNVYTTRGYLRQVVNDATPAKIYWTANQVDAAGNITLQTAGNGLQTARTYDSHTNRLTEIKTGIGDAIQNLAYRWDVRGNLIQRDDVNQVVGATDHFKEAFTYDVHGRLTGTSFNNGTPAKNYAYDAMGNITSKSDVGTYNYSPPGASSERPHAVTSIAGAVNGVTDPTFEYDDNGNLIKMKSGSGADVRTVAYTSFNLPASIVQGGGGTYSWTYDSEHARTTMVGPNNAKTIYLNPRADVGIHVEKKITATGHRWENHIYAGGQVVAIQFDAENDLADGTKKIRYLHMDHLGSTHVLTDDPVAPALGLRADPIPSTTTPPIPYDAFSYDAFGKRRNVGGTDATGTIASSSNRGFTGHEHLDDLGLIHMNGRIYDPVIGRFMTGDPNVQAPLNSQSYNRYSYVLNNPLSLTDPSGFFFGSLFRAIGRIVKETMKIVHMDPVLREVDKLIHSNVVTSTLAVAAACYYSAGAACAPAASWAAANRGGSAEQVGMAGVIAGITAGVGAGASAALSAAGAGPVGMFAGMVAASAVSGCITGELSGGGCGRGAFAAGIAAGISMGVGFAVQGQHEYVQFVVRVTAGGAASVLGGGKFANGAITAAFAYLATANSSGFASSEGGPSGPIGGVVRDASGAPVLSTELTVPSLEGSVREGGPFLESRTSGLHMGVDLTPLDANGKYQPGATVYSGSDGTVLFAGNSGGFGPNTVVVATAAGNQVIYGHMASSQPLTVDAVVRAGQAIGVVGNEGCGKCLPHLHIEIRQGLEPFKGDRYAPPVLRRLGGGPT